MNKKEWKIPYVDMPLSGELLNSGCSPLLCRVLALRGISTKAEFEAFIAEDAGSLHDPMLMTGMAEAVRRIRLAIERKENIAIFGDYDVDGITATCLLTNYLNGRGIQAMPYIPDRTGEGYGLNNAALDLLKSRGASLLITVDCGITAVAEAEHAKEIGLDLIITDHHECGDNALPEAVAVIDCKRPGDGYPHKNLAGVGVALKLACAIEGDCKPVLERYADLVAVGTVADVMPLVGENRYLVKRGLEKLANDPDAGMAALLRESGIDRKKISASTVSFSLAPRLNAAGRLGKASIAARLLLSRSASEATALTLELIELNRQRQNIETEIWDEANRLLSGSTPEVPIVLASDKWHQGVIGIAASRLAEQYSLPAIMICLSEGHGKGSCRSYGGFNLFEALSACREHLSGFGGHALAAGLNIEEESLDAFRAALSEYYRLNKPKTLPALICDILINDPALLSIDNVRSLDMLEPYGNANPKPLMCMSGVCLESCGEVGGGRHLKMKVSLRGESFDAIFFSHTAKELGLREGGLVDLAFTPQINDFRGNVSVQLVVSAVRPHDCNELCRDILEGRADTLWAAAAFTPTRGDFVRVWRMVQRGYRPGVTGEEIIRACPEGMYPECFCLCLMVLLETGLLYSQNGGIYGAEVGEIEGKANLEATEIIRLLRSC